MEKIGFQNYCENVREFYRQYIQSMITPIDQPTERRIAAQIAAVWENSYTDVVPFIGVAGIPAAGKSYLCANLQKLLKEEHGLNALVVSMDGYHYYRKELDQMEDPEHAHARRGAEFTFDSQRFVDEVREAKESGKAQFPSFDHAKKDPEENQIIFDSENDQVVIIEGLYVLLNKKPWKQLQEEDVFEKTIFVNTSEQKTVSRLENRMVNEMKLEPSVAQSRIYNNDLINARYIKDNMSMEDHTVVEIPTPEELADLQNDLVKEFTLILKNIMVAEQNSFISNKNHLLNHLSSSIDNLVNKIDTRVGQYHSQSKDISEENI